MAAPTSQLLYGSLGLTYNLLSFYNTKTNGRPLSPTPPLPGAALMVIYLLGVNWPSSGVRTLATLLSIPGFGYGGIVKHWQNRARMERGELYAGFGAWAAAIAINGFDGDKSAES